MDISTLISPRPSGERVRVRGGSCPHISKTLALFFAFTTAAHARTWTESASTRTFEAEYISATDTTVTLKRDTDDKEFTLPLERLTDEDRAFIQSQLTPPETPPLPKAIADLYDDLPRSFKRDTLPITGDADPKYAPLDDAIAAFMIERNIAALVVAVSQNGEIVYDKAFGYQDAELKTPLQPGSIMRLASVSKPVTAAALKHLIAEGDLKPDDLVFDRLQLDALASSKLDPRWKQITVDHLRYHMGGFDRDVSGDPMGLLPLAAKDQRVPVDELQFTDLLAWMLDRPLDFDPGEREAYSNFGYNLIVHLIEKISGKPYAEYLTETVAANAGTTTLLPGRTDVSDRPDGEVWYHLHPDFDREISPDPLRMEVRAGSGAMTSSAADYCRFLEKYWISGDPRQPGQKAGYTFYGSLPGTTAVAIQRPDGINVTAIANRRDKAGSEWNNELKAAIDFTLAEILKPSPK
jgi:CubicO group peptidase (beta-lactamase class C family)